MLVVVRTIGPVDPAPYELRLRSELRTEGIEAVVVNAGTSETDARALVNRMGASGVIDVRLSEGEASAAVWVVDTSLGIETARSMSINLAQRDAVSVFALRAVDLFVGARMEIEQQRKLRFLGAGGSDSGTAAGTRAPAPSASSSNVTAPAASSGTVTAPAEPKAQEGNPYGAAKGSKSRSQKDKSKKDNALPSPRPVESAQPLEHVRVGAGVALMQFTDLLARRIAPSVSTTIALSPRIRVGLTLTGPYMATIFKPSSLPSGSVETTSVKIDQEFLWLDGRYRFLLNEQFDLEPACGLGVSRYGVSSQGSALYLGRSDHRWSAVGTVGVSLVWRVSPRVRLTSELVTLVRFATPHAFIDTQDETGISPLNFYGSFGPAWVF